MFFCINRLSLRAALIAGMCRSSQTQVLWAQRCHKIQSSYFTTSFYNSDFWPKPFVQIDFVQMTEAQYKMILITLFYELWNIVLLKNDVPINIGKLDMQSKITQQVKMRPSSQADERKIGKLSTHWCRSKEKSLDYWIRLQTSCNCCCFPIKSYLICLDDTISLLSPETNPFVLSTRFPQCEGGCQYYDVNLVHL